MNATSGVPLVAVISPHPETLDAFLKGTYGEADRSGAVALPEMGPVRLEGIAAADLSSEPSVALLRRAAVCLVLVRFVDRDALDELRAALRLLPSEVARNVHMILCRNPGETEFKMSCPKCGQKLMVQDALAFRRVNCPQCRESITIPGQTDLLRAELMLPSTRLIRKVLVGDAASSRHAVEAMLRQSVREDEAAKARTMRLDALQSGKTP